MRVSLSAVMLSVTLLGCLPRSAIHPESHRYNAICEEALTAGELERADTACTQSLAYSEDNAEAWTNRGILRLRRHDVPGAKQALIKALRINPDLRQASNTLCAIYLEEEKNLELAERNCRAALKVDPSYAEALKNLSSVLWHKGDEEGARKTLLTLTLSHPEIAEGWCELGGIELANGRDGPALDYLQRAIALNPRYATAQRRAGIANERLGNFSEAADAYRFCLDAEPNEIECRDGLKRVLDRL